jgi:hypothetical protein
MVCRARATAFSIARSTLSLEVPAISEMLKTFSAMLSPF